MNPHSIHSFGYALLFDALDTRCCLLISAWSQRNSTIAIAAPRPAYQHLSAPMTCAARRPARKSQLRRLRHDRRSGWGSRSIHLLIARRVRIRATLVFTLFQGAFTLLRDGLQRLHFYAFMAEPPDFYATPTLCPLATGARARVCATRCRPPAERAAAKVCCGGVAPD